MSEHTHEERKKPSNTQLFFAAIVLVALAIVTVFILAQSDSSAPENEKMKQDTVQQQTTKTSTPLNTAISDATDTPVSGQITDAVTQPETRPSEQPEPVTNDVDTAAMLELPKLNESDMAIKSSISEYLSEQAMNLLVGDDMIRRTVVYVDNLAQGKVADKHAPLVKPQDDFTAIDNDIVVADPNSYERYTPYVSMLNTMSTAQLVRLYEKYQPLFEEAYEEIGYDGNAFNNTLTDAIDELLATPIPDTALPLVKDSVTYKYAYSEWEQLSPAQKQFLRMGPENMKLVKKRLQEIKQTLSN
ncbi:DUF3014 domain-containing protein [Pseudoalteromonas sp. T1lg65]|uniref:DUF3014 domain-containing protein n=1 Tax=Pseudoalteromonas sp. T1lg65 TaxID=2077101 RepID=UPI003F7AB137